MSRKYAGVGSREAPQPVLEVMVGLASYLAKRGYVLRSGGADGADAAFERGCNMVGGAKEIYLPWPAFNHNLSPLADITRDALDMAAKYHPAWYRLGDAARKLMARNCYQVMGHDLDDPVDFLVCWTPGAAGGGGTGQAIRIARAHDIPVYDLADKRQQHDLIAFLGLPKGKE